MAYVRTVNTASGARAVQIVHGSRKGSRSIEHIWSAHTDDECAALKAAAARRLAAGQGELDLGIADVVPVSDEPLPIQSSRMGHLWDGLEYVYRELVFDDATCGGLVVRDLVLTRIIEPTSKLDSIRVLEQVGVPAMSYPTMNRPEVHGRSRPLRRHRRGRCRDDLR